MLDPLDRHSRDSTLFQFTTKKMRDFVDPKHLTSSSTSRSSSNHWKPTAVATTADPPSTRKCSSGRCSSHICTTSAHSGDCVRQSRRSWPFAGSAS